MWWLSFFYLLINKCYCLIFPVLCIESVNYFRDSFYALSLIPLSLVGSVSTLNIWDCCNYIFLIYILLVLDLLVKIQHFHYYFFFLELEFELRTLHLSDRYCATKQYPQPSQSPFILVGMKWHFIMILSFLMIFNEFENLLGLY